MVGMALEHAILVSLSERAASGLELTRRFDKSIGFFWSATHQQIYRVLGRMEADGWVTSEVVGQQGRPDKKVYAVSDLGRTVLADWLVQPSPIAPLRSELAVKMRAASWGDRAGVLEVVRSTLADHQARLDFYEQLEKKDYPDPDALSDRELDQYLVLRGGIRVERGWVEWLTEYLQAHEGSTPKDGQ
jgi:DNA-binding PadR family transcriptional regulator